MKRVFSAVMFILLLTSMLTLAFNIRPVRASGTIYVRADGSIDPPTAPISTVDNITYTFTGDIFGGLDVQKDNVVIDGANYTLQASGYTSGWPTGLLLSGRTNVTIEYMRIETSIEGIYLENSSGNRLFRNIITSNESDTHPSVSAIILSGCSNNSVCENNIRLSINATPEQASAGILILLSSSYNTISGNTIENTFEGIGLQESSSNCVLGNTIRGNYYGIGVGGANNTISQNNITSGIIGIDLERCLNTIVSGNNVTENSHNGITLYPGALNNVLCGNYIASSDRGIILWETSNNSIYHNSFINNSEQVYIIESSYNNSWDNGYPSGGNYWADYIGVDSKSGSNQDQPGGDGIGDTPYVIDADNIDQYPLMNQFSTSEEEANFVVLVTTMGSITIELYDDMPITTGNFKNLTNCGIYDGTIFHRVVRDFVIQGGDPTGTGHGDPSIPAIPDEFSENPAHNRNERGTIAMAKAGAPNTGRSQFFINLVYNYQLDNSYSVFGRVINGMDVVDAIANVATDANDRPIQNVTILKAQLVSGRAGDLNLDGIVDISDAILAALAFGSYPGHHRWNSQADLNHDNVVDIFDIIMLANKFGKD